MVALSETVKLGSELELAKACLTKQPLDKVSRFCPAWRLSTALSLPSEHIAGTYGLQLTLQQVRKLPYAQCGFDVRNGVVIVANSPQGYTRDRLNRYPKELKTEAFRLMRESDFRSALLERILKVATALKDIGVNSVKGVAAENHEKVDLNGGTLPYELARKSMNDLYEKFGFTQDEFGDYTTSV